MQRTTLTLMLASLLLATSACQPKADLSDPSSESDIGDTTSTSTQQSPTKIVTPKAFTTSLLAASEKKLTNELICTKLTDAMSAIGDNSKFEDIHAIQRQLEACLPITNNPEILQWLAAYQSMYRRFLTDSSNGSDVDDQNFNDVMFALDQGETLPPEQLTKLNPHARYFIRLIKSKKDVRVRSLGEGFYEFGHDLKAMADLFTPYLRKDQSEFIQRMAQDNQEILWSDAAVTASFEELIERAVFWEDYIQRYPNGYSIKDAKNLLDLYRYMLIFGSDNTQWTDDTMHEFLSPEYEEAIRQLTKRPNSILAKDARDYLSFMAMSDTKRQKTYPAPSVDEDGDEMSDWATVRYQLVKATSIHLGEDDSRDCLNGVVCMNSSAE